jgi:NADH-quinone oxidoreductase subunit L
MEHANWEYASFLDSSLAVAFLLPLLSFFFSAIISNRYSWIISLLSPLLLLVTASLAAVVFARVWNGTPFMYKFEWFTVGGHVFEAGILLNNPAVLMFLVVSIISFLVHLFSVGYMAGDQAEKRYFGMLGLFTFAMFGIVLADNLFLIFIFWELVGFASYMLIGHWQNKPTASAAAKKAFLMNRVGDVGFLVGLMIIWRVTGSFSLMELQQMAPGWSTGAALCIFCGVIGKSAQFPLFSWLPDAMEGPTPVSALIHAATMVAAGVFLLARVFFIFSPVALAIVAVIGILTALIGGLAALSQTDIKKILAYSTISQLGLMVTVIGAGAPEVAMLHLFTHAFFKACLFLCAGSVIHSLHQTQNHSHVHFDVQDIRNLGGLRKKLPLTALCATISAAALAGIPFLSGFLSKEAIFNVLLHWKGDTMNGRWIVFVLAFVVTFFTTIYIFRFVARIFFGNENATQNLTVHEPPPVMRAPIALLAIASLWFIVSWNPFNPKGWILPTQSTHSVALTIFSIGWVFLGLVSAWLLFRKNQSLHADMLFHALYIDRFYHLFVVIPTLLVARTTAFIDKKIIDRSIHALAYAQVITAHLAGWFDSAIIDGVVNGTASLSRIAGSFTRSFQSGKIQLYVFWAVFTIIIFLIWSLI